MYTLPLVFNLHSEEMFARALDEAQEGIKVNVKFVNSIRYVDDAVLVVGSEQELQTLLNKVTRAGEQYGLKVNEKKIKTKVISKKNSSIIIILLNSKPIEQVEKFKYLGC